MLKLGMDKRVLDFLGKNRVCVLSVLMKNGAPHAAAMHYSHSNKPLEIYIQTENTSRKMSGFKKGAVKAAIVVGFSEEEFKTLQIEGSMEILPKSELTRIHKIHYTKHPDAKKWKDDPGTVFLVFKPSWWRYTEYKPKFFSLSSEK